jgi:hypothetical protein
MIVYGQTAQMMDDYSIKRQIKCFHILIANAEDKIVVNFHFNHRTIFLNPTVLMNYKKDFGFHLNYQQ